MRRAGPPPGPGGHQPQALVGTPRSYLIRIGGRWYPWEPVRRLLREALELDRPEGERSPEARDLARFLRADRPSLVEYALARPKLEELWRNILDLTP